MLGFAVLMLLYILGDSGAFGGVILNMAVFGAVIAYAMQMWAYVVLRRKLPDIERPYKSPFGNFGAIVALVISLLALFMLFANPDFRTGVIGVALWFLAGLAYFGFYARKRMMLSPEEAFALEEGGQK